MSASVGVSLAGPSSSTTDTAPSSSVFALRGVCSSIHAVSSTVAFLAGATFSTGIASASSTLLAGADALLQVMHTVGAHTS